MSTEIWRRKKAVILAMLLWMIYGDEAKATHVHLVIEEDNALDVSSSLPVGAEVSNSGKSITISGGEWDPNLNWYLRGGISYHLGVSAEGYHLNVEGAKGVYAVYGGVGHGSVDVRGDAAGNDVTIRENSSITDVVCGGFAAGRGDAIGNTVTISDSLVQGKIFGGKSGRYGNVRENSVTLENSRANAVYGGYSEDGDATENRVVIRNSKAVNVYGGRGGTGKKGAGNQVLLDHADISGRVSGVSDNARNWEGCTLLLSGSENKADKVQRFEEIKLTGTLSWKDHGTLMKAGSFDEWDKKLDVSEAAFSSVTTPGVMTLLSSERENDFSDISLKYRGGTARLNGENLSQKIWVGHEETRKQNGVKLSYHPVHRVILDDVNHYKNVFYEIENQVQTISPEAIVWRTGGTACVAGPGYDFSEADLNTKDFRFQNPEDVPRDGTMNMLSRAEKLPSSMGSTGISTPYVYSPEAGVTVNGHIMGDISVEGDCLLYKAHENRADRITFGRVAWKDEGALMVRPTNIEFDGAAVDTSQIYFHNVASLRANQSMVLVKDFGNSVGSITGETYTVGTTLTGKGRASLLGRNLVYRVETGTDSAGVPSLEKSPEPAISSDAPIDSTSGSDKSPVVNARDLPKNKAASASRKGSDESGQPTQDGTDKASVTAEANNVPSGEALAPMPVLTAQEQTHNTVMGMEAGMAALAAGNDFIAQASEGLSDSAQTGADGVAAFAAMGSSRTEYETGSYVKGSTWNAILALGRKHEYTEGILEWGGFIEHGAGSFNVHGNTGIGELSSGYTGGGVLSKWTDHHGLYVEGSIRGGRMHDTASDILRDALGGSYGYDVRANYRGGHVGIGRIYRFHGNRSLDVYGKFFLMKREGVSFDAGGQYVLDAVTSRILRLGARYSAEGQKWNWYGGFSWNWEFDGEASGTADGARIRSASIRGGSLGAELGIRMDPTENSPWKVDIGLSGYMGKHRGVGGNVAFAYVF